MRETIVDRAAASPKVSGLQLLPGSFTLHVSERRVILLVMDLLALNAALFIALAVRPYFDPTLMEFILNIRWFIVLSLLWIAVAVPMTVYDLAVAASKMQSVWRTGRTALLTAFIYLLIPYVTPALSKHRSEVLLFPVLAVLALACWRIFYATVFVRPKFQQRALIVGRHSYGDLTYERMHAAGYSILGSIDDEASPRVSTQLEVLGTMPELAVVARKLRVDEVVVASGTLNDPLLRAILDCREMGISITTLAEVYERLTGRVPVAHGDQSLHVVFPLRQAATHRFYLAIRRIADLVIGMIGCVLLVEIAPAIWLINQITSRGPLFYRQSRVGIFGKEFVLYKFRSMKNDAETNGAVWADKNDSRITPIGRLLRRSRLDELPQFWNILKGDMTLIGPRPERPEFVRHLAQNIPFYKARHAVHPGLTGWAQVKYRYGASVEESLIKLEHDLYYIKHQGLYLDVVILLRTMQVILGFQGR